MPSSTPSSPTLPPPPLPPFRPLFLHPFFPPHQVGYGNVELTSIADVKKAGANVVNLHQGVDTLINPYINYPFDPESVALLSNYTKEANEQDVRVKFYYTVRELSNHAAELFALRMMGDEIFSEGPAGGCGYDSGKPCTGETAWQSLHLGGNFSAAWTNPLSNGEYDAAIRQNQLAGRWLNYYIEGLRQSVAEAPRIQGVYYDGLLFGRDTMLRARKVLERDTPAGHPRPLMDFHAGNDDSPGRATVDAVAYANVWAFVDSLWIGEGFSYDSGQSCSSGQSPTSSLFFGCSRSRELLSASSPTCWAPRTTTGACSSVPQVRDRGEGQRGGRRSDDEREVIDNCRIPPSKYSSHIAGRPALVSARSMWDFRDVFKIEESDMVGFWQEDNPIKVADQPDIFVNDSGVLLSTCYVNKREKRTLIAIASWAKENRSVTLVIDWEAIGMVCAVVYACGILTPSSIAMYVQ
jgi:hypothetical protein